MVNKKESVVGFTILFCLLIGFGFVFATTIMNNPAYMGNYSTTLNISCNVTDIMASSSASYNVSVYWNISGDALDSTLLYTMHNTTGAQVLFENATVDISSFADGKAYNFTCYADNGSDQVTESMNITIDNTPPNVSTFVVTSATGDFVNATNNWNYTTTDGLLFSVNVSVSDALMGMDAVYLNWTFSNGTQKNWTNASANVGAYYNYSMNISDFPDGAYNITVWANDTQLGNLNNSEYLYVKFDTTVPAVTFVTSNGANISGTSALLNVSSVDATIGTESVYYNISNTVGLQHNFTKASTIDGTYYNISLNTAGFTDGVYNVTVWANDSQIGNINKTEKIQIRIDNTPPTVPVITCTPTEVNIGELVTCGCGSATDSGSGLRVSSPYTFTVNPSTTESGTFTTTCTVTDRVGNTNSSTDSYTVISGAASSGGSGGGGGTTFSYTYSYDRLEQEFNEIKTINQELRAKQRVRVKINGETHQIGIREITTTSATVEIASNPVQVKLNIGEDAKVDVDDDNFYDVYVKLNSIKNGYADLTINYLNEEIPAPEEGEESSSVETSGEVVEQEDIGTSKEETSLWMWFVVGGIILVLIIVGSIVAWKKRN